MAIRKFLALGPGAILFILKALSIPRIVWGLREPPKRVLFSNRVDGKNMSDERSPATA